MKSETIRKLFIDYFVNHPLKHHHYPSSSIVPENDPTLLFANAGMNQFKDFFTGKINPPHPRAVSVQKVVRAGGKHNDLDNVGFTARHHTFFEMLGNFSFGNYFKKEAITTAFEFLTQVLKLDTERIWVTVFEEDQEAYDLWKNHIGFPSSRIVYKGAKDNFWEMGDLGPCGPCSEIYYDHGEKYSDPKFNPKTAKDPLEDEGRFVEIWNLVFMQFEQTRTGRVRLPNPSIDTGAGLERVSAVMQNVYWNYDTDLFLPLIHKIRDKVGTNGNRFSTQVVSDHMRAATMLISDGVIPSAEGRGYVLRRIIRRAVRHLQKMEIRQPYLHHLVDTTFDILGDAYPQNKSQRDLVVKFLELEEKKFRETLSAGLKLFEEGAMNLAKGETKFPGELAFKLYDSFGLPLDLTETLAAEKHLTVDTAGFEREMQKQIARSQKSWKSNEEDQSSPGAEHQLKNEALKFPPTQFVGYELSEIQSELLAIIDYSPEQVALVFKETPFYAESGGQVGDVGFLGSNHFEVAIQDTQIVPGGPHLHLVKKNNIQHLVLNKQYTLCINNTRRAEIRKHHSATHLLQAALVQVLGSHVQQAGSKVTDESLRFDFTHFEAPTKEQLSDVEKLINIQIGEQLPVSAKVMSKDLALNMGAKAFFGDKYGSEVRVLTMGQFSIELCGGTHVNNTSDIRIFKIISESSLSSGVRRIEAKVSTAALEWLNNRSQVLSQIEGMLSVKGDNTITAVSNLKNEIKSLKKSDHKVAASPQLDWNQLQIKIINTIPTLCLFIAQDVDLKLVSDELLNAKMSSDPKPLLLFLVKKSENQIYTILLKTSNLPQIKCGNLLRDFVSLHKGRGGGKDLLAQGSISWDKAPELLVASFENFIGNAAL